MILLENENLRVEVDPELGAGLTRFDVRVPGGWHPILAQAPELPVASFLMVPWSNRVEGGRFSFEGREITLPEPERHAIHGLVRKRPWEVLHTSPDAVALRFRWPGGAWPWPFVAEVHHTLGVRGLRSAVTITQEGTTTMPAGLGFHPYFTRGDAVVQFSVRGIYPDAHDTRIPSGPAAPPDPIRDFSRARPLDPAVFMDFCAHGWGRTAHIDWPARGLGLDVSSDLDHLVFFNPPRPYFALEPVSNANDGFNLLHRGDPTHGVRLLPPGGTTSGWMEMHVRRG